ncbi:hypothetical protein AB685_07680 [Bacillus sp. LL01]|nr:hypothetical protein AB685_07680 [Bacillus sp. LL01]
MFGVKDTSIKKGHGKKGTRVIHYIYKRGSITIYIITDYCFKAVTDALRRSYVLVKGMFRQVLL